MAAAMITISLGTECQLPSSLMGVLAQTREWQTVACVPSPAHWMFQNVS